MSLLVVIVALLLAGALGLLDYPWPGKGRWTAMPSTASCTSRRLQGWRRSAARDNPALVVELLRTLLTDILPRHSLANGR